jgi:hypothetical protein
MRHPGGHRSSMHHIALFLRTRSDAVGAKTASRRASLGQRTSTVISNREFLPVWGIEIAA